MTSQIDKIDTNFQEAIGCGLGHAGTSSTVRYDQTRTLVEWLVEMTRVQPAHPILPDTDATPAWHHILVLNETLSITSIPLETTWGDISCNAARLSFRAVGCAVLPDPVDTKWFVLRIQEDWTNRRRFFEFRTCFEASGCVWYSWVLYIHLEMCLPQAYVTPKIGQWTGTSYKDPVITYEMFVMCRRLLIMPELSGGNHWDRCGLWKIWWLALPWASQADRR